MKNLCNICKTQFHRKLFATLVVCVFWVSGLLFGRFYASAADTAAVYTARLSAAAKPIHSLHILGQLLPLAVTILLVRFAPVRFLCPVIFLDAFCFGYVAFLAVRAFGTAGWLVYRILLFSECVNAFILLWLWVNVVIDRQFLSLKKLCLISCAMYLLTVFDSFICSGFLISVLT